MKRGKVYLAGAGPGDPLLITLKCLRALSECDALVYDHLASPHHLALLSPDAERIYAGKRAGRHTLSQGEINRLLVKLARDGRRVVRLKGGDPFLFGRGGEEAQFLKKAGVDFEVIPGIPSPIAVPAYAGIPVTHRNYTSTFIVVTGNEDPKKEDSSIDWDLLGRIRGTITFLMGVGRLKEICERLIMEGRSRDEPCALIMNGTSGRQKIIRGSLATIHKRASLRGLKPPAIFIIGRVTELSEELDWYSGKPLSGKRFLLLSPSMGEEEDLANLLEGVGGEVFHIPSIRIEPLLEGKRGGVIDAIRGSKVVVFTSRNGVRLLFPSLLNRGVDVRVFSGKRVVSIGAATSSALLAFGIIPDARPGRSTTAEIPPLIQGMEGVERGDRVCLLRSLLGSRELREELKRMGFVVDDIPIYTAVTAMENTPLLRDIIEEGVDYMIFTSPSTAKGFFEMMGDEAAFYSLKGERIISIGPVTSEWLEGRGITDLIAPESDHSAKGVFDVIMDSIKGGEGGRDW